MSLDTYAVWPRVRRIWIWIVLLTVILGFYPVEYRLTRIASLMGMTAVWSGALILWWRHRCLRFTLMLAVALLAATVSIPGRAPDPTKLILGYCEALRWFTGVRYVWGGEGFLGIDCSGLVRKGLIWAELAHGIRSFNGTPIREALRLWWDDCTAEALGMGHGGRTIRLFEHESINSADSKRLMPGDLAVTADGVHVMACLGDGRWIEADPDAHKVIEVAVPSENPWFNAPVVFVRWTQLETAQPQKYAP